MKFSFLCLWGFLVLPGLLPAQKIDNTSSFRNIMSDSYSRVHYDNDKFSGTDKNYTMGYSLEVVSPFFSKNPVNYLFFKPSNSETKFGIATENIGFSPNNIKSPEIQNGERPFAAVFMLKSFAISTNTIHKSSLTSSLNLGLIGPGAFGEEVQVYVHKSTGKPIPEGWRNQMENDLVLNYDVGYEKQVFRMLDFLSLNTNSNLRVGTLYTNASLGLSTTVGLINSPFTAVTHKKSFRLYSYSQITGSVIGYDATLQGGVFNNKNSYTIPSKQIERLTRQLNYGLVLQAKLVYFEYFRTALTREFTYGDPTKWGGIKFGVQF
jgi:lipid A 3-O-deacylase